MVSSSFLFYVFSICLVISTFMVIFSKHSIFSILFLAATFIFSSILLFLLECELLGLFLLVIYLGAILVLFLFAVMMLESKFNNLKKSKIKYIPVGFIFSIFLLLPLLMTIDSNFVLTYDFNFSYLNIYQNWYDLTDSIRDVQVYSQILYSYYVLQFLVSGLILMLILLGVVYLTSSFYKQKINHQSIFKQLSRNVVF